MQVKDGRVRNISVQNVKPMQQEGWVVLDVRPCGEHEKAPVANSVHVSCGCPEQLLVLPLRVQSPSDSTHVQSFMYSSYFLRRLSSLRTPPTA
jgi:hypothetical protein